MKYLYKGQDNTFTLKISSSIYSGTSSGWVPNVFYFTFYHNQTQFTTGFSLTDISDKPIVYSKFFIPSGITESWNGGQYEVNVYEDSSKKINVFSLSDNDNTIYIVLKDIITNTDVFYNGTPDNIIIYKK